MTRIDRLELIGFRGVVSSTIPFDGGSVVLGGENGSGKTAFVDALEFLYTGSIAALSGTTGIGLKQHGAHIRSDPQHSSVTAYFEEPEASAARWLSGTLEAGEEIEDHLRRGSKLTFILRRSQLQSFIHAKPAERYRSLAELIGLDRLDNVQSVTRRAWDVIQRGVVAMENELRVLELEDSEANHGFDEAALLSQLRDTLRELRLDAFRIGSLDDVARLRSELLESVSNRPPDQPQVQRAQLAASLQTTSHERLSRNLFEYLEILGKQGGERGEVDLQELDLLVQGRDILQHRTDAHHCPLCESEINSRAVVTSLVRRIRELETVNIQRQELDRARQDLDTSLQDASTRLRGLRIAADGTGTATDSLDSLLDSFTMLRDSLNGSVKSQVRQMAERLETTLDNWERWKGETVEGLAASEARAGKSETDAVAQALSALETAGIRRAAAMRAQSERERRQERKKELLSLLKRRRAAADLALRINETFTRVRNEEIQRLFDELQSDLAHFYELLHPGEGHHALSIAMDLRKRGSTDLRLDFYERSEQDPRAFISEGHLDSLGLCIFLAFVRRFNGDWPLLVLDDVVTSVDASHKSRIARLLFQEFPDHQLFITTQDGRWFNEIRRIQAEIGRDNVQNLVIEAWTLENGPAIRSAA
jgi:DNA repair exonuclease SbcCD ATPase subunit